MKWLIYGSNGWIGKQVINVIKEKFPDDKIISGYSRVDDEQSVEHEIDYHQPDRVICLIGRTHGKDFSTIDYLEQPGKLVENVRDNLYGPMTLAFICHRHGIHLTYMGTGCIFTYDQEHSLDNNNGFTEKDRPNYFDSSYSIVKGFTDRLMHFFENSVLNVRIRMPITSLDHPRNFISKIIRYTKICSVPNSMTVLDQLLPIMVDMMVNRQVGTINLTNPGSISHNRILDLYRELIDPEFIYQNFTDEEQRKILLSGRSNNLLDTSLLKELYPEVEDIEQAIITTLKRWKKSDYKHN